MSRAFNVQVAVEEEGGGGRRVAVSAAARRSVAERRLAMWNEFMVFLARLNKRMRLSRKAGEARRHRPIGSLFYADYDPRGTIGVVSLRLSRLAPSLKDVNYVIYVSAQVSKKKVPKQAVAMSARLRKKQVIGDTIKVAIAPRGYTRGAWRILRKSGIHLCRDSRELIELFKKYVEKRAENLRLALRGKRIWGDVAIVALALYEILNAARVKIVRESALVDLYDAAVTGRSVDLDEVIVRGSAPPPGAPS